MSLHDMRQGLVIGSLEAVTNGKAPMVIQNFSKGFRGNGIGYAIKAPSAPAPPKPKPPVADPPPASADPLPASSVTPHEGGGVEEEGKGDSTPKPSMAKPAKAKAKKGGKKVDKVKLSPAPRTRARHDAPLPVQIAACVPLRRRPPPRSARRMPISGSRWRPPRRPRRPAALPRTAPSRELQNGAPRTPGPSLTAHVSLGRPGQAQGHAHAGHE